MGFVRALDGISVRIIKPRECADPAQYWCRKDFYALPVQAVADARYRFTYLFIMCGGSAHDSIALSVSSVGRRLRAGVLHTNYWYAGDDHLHTSVRKLVLTPIPSSRGVPGSAEATVFESGKPGGSCSCAEYLTVCITVTMLF